MRNGQGADASRMTRSSVTIQITPESKPSTPSWMGEVAAFAHRLTHTGILKAIQEQVRFTRARGCLITTSSILSSCSSAMDCRENQRSMRFTNNSLRLPSRSWLSLVETSCPIARPFLAFWPLAIRQVWRRSGKLFQEDLLARKPFASPGGLFDRTGAQRLVVDVDGTRQAARKPGAAADGSLACSSSAIRSGVRTRVSRTIAWEKLSGRAHECSRHIRISSSARSEDLAMGITGVNCDGPSR